MKHSDKKESRLHYAARLFKNEGLLAVVIRTLEKIQKSRQRTSKHKKHLLLLGDMEDILKADWSSGSSAQRPVAKIKTPCTLAWVMSPPGESSGGHQNIFRFIKGLDSKGYRNYIYLYSTNDHSRLSTIKERIKSFYDLDINNVQWLNAGETIEQGDAVFATGWETAYPVYNAPKNKKKFYFVQDFEPMFYPMGSEYVLAENTYKLGLTGITAGKWLAQKLSADYGMRCLSYDFGSEKKLYSHTNDGHRKEVFFYARPITSRRGFELGLMTLQKFHELNPDYVINLAGWDVSEYDIPFPYVNHKALKLHELSDLYNKCAVGLVISLTNMSLLPLELLTCGTIPVVNEGQNNRLVSDNKYIEYAPPSPDALAKAMDKIVNAKDATDHAKKAAASVNHKGWEASVNKFVNMVEEELHG
jgi:glycosyltransferase involved in cell wall biosynthesis